MKKINLLEALDYIKPADLSYQEWLNVGMGLHKEGYTAADWDNWSRADERYKPGECFRKWMGFRAEGGGNKVTGGTIVEYAKRAGWAPNTNKGLDYGLEWDAVISDEYQVIEKGYIEDEEVHEPNEANWDPVGEITRYIEALFDATDYVGYVTEVYDYAGELKPTKGSYTRTAGELLTEFSKCNGDIGKVIGDYNEKAGAWIRFNPLDGKGVKNENVTDYRYALVESDSLEVEKQIALLKELEMPLVCMVHSGGKSVHGIVKIEAGDFAEYRKRVDYLYTICQKNGFTIDKQNRNPSRLSRLPGIIRNGKKQFIIATNIGKKSWEEWVDWVEGINDDLPDPESLADTWDNLPPKSPALIEGILRQGHKMLVAGPSKAGKSFALIQLCIAIAEGKPWLGWHCAQGRVMYVNLELDRASCLHRFKDVYTDLDYKPTSIKNIDIWNLRGKSVPMDKLAPKLIRRAQKKEYIAIVIDPIYKVITGDENSADQMAHFANQFDKIATDLGCAVIYCHHHSKGSQIGKKSMDRASGSGVFARDPDALLDMTELALPDELQEGHRTAWRIEGVLREYERFKPKSVYFEYPIHRVDETGELDALKPEDGKPLWQKGVDSRKSKEEKQEERFKNLEKAYYALNIDGNGVRINELAEYMDVTKRTIQRTIKEHGGFKNISAYGQEATFVLEQNHQE